MEESSERLIAAVKAMQEIQSAARLDSLGLVRLRQRLPEYETAMDNLPAGAEWINRYRQNRVFRVGVVSGRSRHEVAAGLLANFANTLSIILADLESERPSHDAFLLIGGGVSVADLDELAVGIEMEANANEVATVAAQGKPHGLPPNADVDDIVDTCSRLRGASTDDPPPPGPPPNNGELPVIKGPASTDYKLFSDIQKDHLPADLFIPDKQLKKFLHQEDDIRLGRPAGRNGGANTRRLLVHVGDFVRNVPELRQWWNAQRPNDSDPVDPARVEAVRKLKQDPGNSKSIPRLLPE